MQRMKVTLKILQADIWSTKYEKVVWLIIYIPYIRMNVFIFVIVSDIVPSSLLRVLGDPDDHQGILS